MSKANRIRVPRRTDDDTGSAAAWWYFAGTAMLRCPNCGRQCFLNHEIAEDGTVNPSVICPFAGCGFHDWITLVGWSERNLDVA